MRVLPAGVYIHTVLHTCRALFLSRMGNSQIHKLLSVLLAPILPPPGGPSRARTRRKYRVLLLPFDIGKDKACQNPPHIDRTACKLPHDAPAIYARNAIWHIGYKFRLEIGTRFADNPPRPFINPASALWVIQSLDKKRPRQANDGAS